MDMAELNREVHCLRASLSEHDLESVGGLSGRATIMSIFVRVHSSVESIQGFLRTRPSSEKKARPGRE